MKAYDSRPSENGTISKDSIFEELANLATSVSAAENSEKQFVEYAKATADSVVTNFNDWCLIYDYGQNNSGEASVETKTFSVTVPEGAVVLGKYYMLAVTGSDVDDVVFLQDTAYGFEGNEAGVAPTLTIDSPTNAELKATSDFVFSGTAKVSSGSLYVSELKATLTVTDQDTNDVVETYSEDISRTSVDSALSGSTAFVCDTAGNWTFTPSALDDYSTIEVTAEEGKSYLYTLDLYGKSSSGHNITISSYVQIDSVLPKVEITSITPTVDGSEYDNSENTYVNGTVTVKGNIEETNLENVSMQIFVDGSVVSSYFTDSEGNTSDTLNLGKVYSFSQTIDTTKLTDGKSLDIRVTATDKVGNETTYSSLSSSGTSYGKLKILQETDQPIISLGNSSNTDGTNSTIDFITDFSNISETNGNLFGTTTNNKLTATITDDDSIAQVDVTIYDSDGNELDANAVYNAYAVNPLTLYPKKSSYNLTYYLPPTEGVYKVCIDAYDYITTDLATNPYGKATTGEYYIAVSAGAPTITVGSYNAYQSKSPSFSGTISTFATGVTATFVGADSSDSSTYQKTLETQPATFTADLTNVSSGKWSATLADGNALSDGNYSVLFTAQNSYGQTNSTTVTFTVDTNAPTVAPTSLKGKVNLDESRYVTVVATIDDGTSGSGISSAYYKVTSSETTWQTTDSTTTSTYVSSDTLTSDWTTLSQGSSDWNSTLNLDSSTYTSDGTAYVYFAAVDQAGNIGVSSSAETLIIDATLPTVTLYSDEDCTTEISSSSASPWIRNASNVTDGKIEFYAKVVDSNVATSDGLTASSNNDVVVEELETTSTSTYTIYKITMTVDTTGTTTTATFTGHDTNSRESTATNIYVKCDTTKPVIDSVTATATTTDSGKYINQANSAVISGTVTENNISTVTVYLLSDSAAQPTSSDKNSVAIIGDETASSTTSAKQFNWSATVTGVDDGTYYVAVVAVDTFGNTTTEINKLTYIVDTTVPVVSDLKVTSGDTTITSVNTATTGDVVITATVTDVTSGLGTVYLYDGTTNLNNKVSTSSTTDGKYTFTISSSNVSSVLTTGSHTLTIYATDLAGNLNSSVNTSISSDVTVPEVSITDISPDVTVTESGVETTYVNGKITVTGSASDETALDGNALAITIYKTPDTTTDLSTTTDLISEVSSGSYTLSGISKNWKFYIDTTKLTDEASYIIKVSATDKAGNSTTSEEKTINVKQSTDTPSIEVTSGDDSSISAITDLVGNQKNIFTTGGKITATITDDDGIASVTVSYKGESDSDYTPSSNLVTTTGRTTANISYTLPDAVTEGGYLIKIEVKDSAQETTSYLDSTGTSTSTSVCDNSSEFAIAVDNGVPEITLTNTNGNYYNSTFDVSGTVTDGSGNISIVMSGSGTSSSYASEVSTSSTTATLSDTITVSSLSDNTNDGYTATYTATDRWGRTNTASVKYYVDKTAPTLSSENDTIGSITGYSTINSSWFKDESLKAGGQITESGSGIEAIYYWLSQTENTITKGTDVSTAIGSFGAKTDNSSSTYNYKYSSTIPDFATGTNYLALVAVDNAGNHSEPLSYTIQVDNAEPEFVENSMKITVNETISNSSTLLVNGSYDVTISGQVYDKDSKINTERVYISIGGSKITATGTTLDAIGTATDTSWQKASLTVVEGTDETTYNFTVTIPKEQLKEANSGAVYLLITDNAENRVNNVNLVNITIDQTAPTVTLNVPSDADTSTVDVTEVNGTITLSGTASDENQLSKISEIQYSTDQTTWETLSSVTFEGTTSWTTNDIDTSQFTDETTYYFRAKALDVAQNEGTSNVITVKISQDSDRPIVKINNLTQTDSNFILKYGTDAQVTGTITDDDSESTAVVETLVISESSYTGSETVTGTTTFSKTSGDFTFKPTNTDDGEKTFYIYIKDNKGGIFYTTATTSSYLNNPKLYLQTTKLDDSYAAKVFTYKSDGNSPSVINAESYTYNTSGTINTTTDTEGNTVNYLETVGASFIVGGINKSQLQFVITASDANGISGMKFDLTKGTASIAKYATASSINGTELGTSYATTYDSGSATFTATTDSTNAVWTTGLIDISDSSVYSSGTYTLNVTAYDTSGLYGTGSYSFVIDQTAPTILISSPLSTEEVTGTTTVQGTAIDSGGSATANTYWFVPTQTQIDFVTSGSEQSYWYNLIKTAIEDDTNTRVGNTLDSTSSESIWAFTFGTNAPALSSFDDSEFVNSSNTSLYTIPLYIMSEDELGNYVVETGYTIKHNPDGDKPVTTITYPDESPTTLGGTIRISGTVTIPSASTTASALFIQIDSSESFTDDYVTDKKDTSNTQIYTIYSAADAIYEVTGNTVTNTDYKTYGFSSSEEFDSWWGIEATKSSSSTLWTRNINANGEFDPSTSGETNTIYLRACGINANGKFGAWTDTYEINVDNSAPIISYELNQFSSITQSGSKVGTSDADVAVTATSTASKQYSANMYLKGQWYITATVLDESGISALTVSEIGSAKNSYNVITGTTNLSIPSEYYIATATEDNRNGYKIYIPVTQTNLTTSDSVVYTVEVTDTDGTSHTSKMEFDLNIDNTAPTIDYVYGNGDTVATDGTAGFSTDSRYKVKEKNYVFSPSGKVSDSGSGYERVLFQFVRNSSDILSSGTQYVLDPMIANSDTSDYSATKIEITGNVVAQTVTQDSSNSYSLYGKNISGTLTDINTFTATTSDDIDDHIRKYGVVYIEGVYRIITGISDGVVSFSPELPSDPDTSTTVTAFFPYAQVVDNTSTERLSTSESANPYTLSVDDGDGMMESVTKIGTTWTWDATIHSVNLPDGPARMIVLAFDAAGNVSGVEIPIMVANNAPRLAKLWLGTDLNSNSTFESNEFETYNLLGSDATEGLETVTKDLENKYTAKNRLALLTEFTGGNGDIKMTFLRDSTSTSAITEANSSDTTLFDSDATATASSNAATLSSSRGSNLSLLNVTTFFSSSTVNAYVLSNANITGSTTDDETKDGTDKNFSFTFWDSTDETTCGTNSQTAQLVLTNMTLDLVDGTPPTVVINPFYWASNEDNSLYDNSASNGHIELGTDLPSKTFTDSSGEYDTDPKVSGKIVFTGTAYDEHILKELKFALGTSSDDDAYMSGTIASYDSSTSAWTAGTGTLDSNGWVATITATDSSTSVGNYYSDTTYYAQAGHKVYWTLTVDTEKLSSIAATDVILTVTASDGTNSSTSSTATAANTTSGYTVTDGTTHVPTYQMDVVPYIAGVKTSLSSLKKSNSSLYDRTALGHYSVRSGETIYVYGFNLSGGSLYDSSSNTATLTSETASEQSWYSSSAVPAGSVYSVGDISSFTSGNVYVKVNNISTLNNQNSDDAKGDYTETTTSTTGDSKIYANYYNRQPNGDSNNLLTDDVVLDVWQFNSEAAVPISGKIEQPQMAIDPVTGQIGFAFVNGPLYFSMAGSTENSTKTSYDYWMGSYDFFTSVGFAYDSLGYTYGVAAGGDINSASADKFQFMTSRWGIASRTQSGSYANVHSRRLESIGMQGTKSNTSDTTYYFDKQRIKSPSIATAVHDSDTNVYLAYYDAMNDELRFKSGNTANIKMEMSSYDYRVSGSASIHILGNSFAEGDTIYLLDSNYELLTETSYTVSSCVANGSGYVLSITESSDDAKALWDTYVDKLAYVGTTNAGDFDNFTDYDTAGIPYAYRNETVSIIAGDGTSYGAGSYVSLGVIPGTTSTTDVVVAIWYDENSRVLWYSYNTEPLTSHAGTSSREGWSTPVQIFSGDYENAGEYCQLAVDANGGIHIAAYDGSNCDLVYAYLSSYDGTAETCVVDTSGVVGSNLTIDVALDSSENAIPRIGYYATSCVRPKLAYRVDTTSDAPTGCSDDAFTGAWECTVVPTSSSVSTQSNQYNKMNVGVWKDSSGVVTTSKSGTSSYTNDASSYNSTSYGFVWGNGTSNAVMGYAIKASSSSDAIETAQMK